MFEMSASSFSRAAAYAFLVSYLTKVTADVDSIMTGDIGAEAEVYDC